MEIEENEEIYTFMTIKEKFNKPEQNKLKYGSGSNLSQQGFRNSEDQMRLMDECNSGYQTLPRMKPKSKRNEQPEAGNMLQYTAQLKGNANLESKTELLKTEPQAASTLQSFISTLPSAPDAGATTQSKPKTKVELNVATQPRRKLNSTNQGDCGNIPRFKGQSKGKKILEFEIEHEKTQLPITESQTLPRRHKSTTKEVSKIISLFDRTDEAGPTNQFKALPKSEKTLEPPTLYITEPVSIENKSNSESKTEIKKPSQQDELNLPIADIKSKFKKFAPVGVLPQCTAQSDANPDQKSQTLPRSTRKSRLEALLDADANSQQNSRPITESEQTISQESKTISTFDRVPEAEISLKGTISKLKMEAPVKVLPQCTPQSSAKPDLKSQTLPRSTSKSRLEALLDADAKSQQNSRPITESEQTISQESKTISTFDRVPEAEISLKGTISKLKMEAPVKVLPQCTPQSSAKPDLKSQTLPRSTSKSRLEALLDADAKFQQQSRPNTEPEQKILQGRKTISTFDRVPEAEILLKGTISKLKKEAPVGDLPQPGSQTQFVPGSISSSHDLHDAMHQTKLQLNSKSQLHAENKHSAEYTSKSNDGPEAISLLHSGLKSQELQRTNTTVASEAKVTFESQDKVEPKCESNVPQLKESPAEGDIADKDKTSPISNFTCTCGRTITLGDILGKEETSKLTKKPNNEELFSGSEKLADSLSSESKGKEEGVMPELKDPVHKSIQEQPPPPPPPLPAPSPAPPPPPPAPRTNQIIVNPSKVDESTLTRKKRWNVTGIRRIVWKTIDPNRLNDKSFWKNTKEERFGSSDLLERLKTTFPSENRKKLITTKWSTESSSFDAIAVPTTNLLIIVKALKLPSSEAIRKCILACEQEAFSVEILTSLLRSLNRKALDEIRNMMRSNDEATENYHDILYKLAGINMLFPRLESMLIKFQHTETFQDIKPRIESGIKACKNVLQSEKLKKILELILLIGNIMSCGNNINPAHAFELSLLSTLAEIKGAKKDTSMLHFLFDYIEEKFPDLVTFNYELEQVEEASKLSIADLRSCLKTMKDNIQKLESALSKHVAQNNEDKFSQVMGPFAKQARKEYDELLAMFETLEASYNDVADYFSLDKTQYTTENFFSDLKFFTDSFTNVYREKLSKRELEKAREDKELEKKSKASSPNWRKYGKTVYKTEIYRYFDAEDRRDQEASGGLSRKNCRIIKNKRH